MRKGDTVAAREPMRDYARSLVFPSPERENINERTARGKKAEVIRRQIRKRLTWYERKNVGCPMAWGRCTMGLVASVSERHRRNVWREVRTRTTGSLEFAVAFAGLIIFSVRPAQPLQYAKHLTR
jgi:hypothetical protein